VSSPQPPNQPPRDNPIGDAADRTQVVRPGQGSDEGPERTQAMQPGQPPPQQPSGGADRTQVVRPAQPPQQQQRPGGFNPSGQQQGGFNPGGQQGGGFNPAGQQGGFNPNPQGPPSGGFSPGGPGGPPQGGFNPGGGYPGGQQGGFSPGGGGPSGFGPPSGAPSGFGPGSVSDNDKMIALGAAGSAALAGLIVVILGLSTIGYIFDLSTGAGFLLLLQLLAALGMIGGGVLIYQKNKLGPYVAGGCAAFVALFALIGLISVFTGGGVVILILVLIPAVLAFMPQTGNYVKSGAGQQGPQGGYGRPF